MFADTCPSEPQLPGYIRADARLAAGFAPTPRGTRVARLRETGGYRLKFPRGPHCEAVIVNTGGGMAGGDRLAVELSAEPGAAVTVSTQSAEKIYRAQAEPARLQVRLELGAGAALHWLPQETILFAGARLDRRLEVTLAADATLTLCEILVCGRTAMGEAMTSGAIRDHWRIRRAGRLVYAEALRLEGDLAAALARPAVAGGGHVVATLLRIAPGAEALVEPLRERLAETPVEAGVSGWDGLAVARLVGPDAAALRRCAVGLLAALPGPTLPRIWNQ